MEEKVTGIYSGILTAGINDDYSFKETLNPGQMWQLLEFCQPGRFSREVLLFIATLIVREVKCPGNV